MIDRTTLTGTTITTKILIGRITTTAEIVFSLGTTTITTDNKMVQGTCPTMDGTIIPLIGIQIIPDLTFKIITKDIPQTKDRAVTPTKTAVTQLEPNSSGAMSGIVAESTMSNFRETQATRRTTGALFRGTRKYKQP